MGSSLLLFFAWIPLIILYCVWLPLTLSGKIKTFEHVSQLGDVEMNTETYQHPDIAKQFPKHNSNDIKMILVMMILNYKLFYCLIKLNICDTSFFGKNNSFIIINILKIIFH